MTIRDAQDEERFLKFVKGSLQYWIEKEADEVLKEAEEMLRDRIRKRMGQFVVDLASEFDVIKHGSMVTIRLKDQTERKNA